MDTILRKGGHNFTMKQRCSSRVAKCTYEIRRGDGESHAAAQEGELHKKSDDARAGGAECTGSMMPPSYNRERGPPWELERRLATVRLERSTPMPVYPGGLAFV